MYLIKISLVIDTGWQVTEVVGVTDLSALSVETDSASSDCSRPVS